MSIEIKVPVFPESVAEGAIASWQKQVGDVVEEGDVIVEIETDKVVMEVPALHAGVVTEHKKAEGDTVMSEEVIGSLDDQAGGQPSSAEKSKVEAPTDKTPLPQTSPAVRRLLSEHGIDEHSIKGTGKDGRIVREDVEAYLAAKPSQSGEVAVQSEAAVSPVSEPLLGERIEKRVPMTRLRKTIAKRLLDVQQNNAILTTFNEVDMKPVMDLRSQYKDMFLKQHDVKLGFMSFFVKATVEALKRIPAVNASIDGDDVVYHGYFDISVAVSSPRGLVVPVVRNAEQMDLAGIESAIKALAIKARDGQLSLDEMQGGTFTITNGGTFGSMLSTPIINQPQSAILGMHNIVERPVAINGEVCIRPIMYLALSYDHRLIDGKEAVTFLKTIKELLEDPARILLRV